MDTTVDKRQCCHVNGNLRALPKGSHPFYAVSVFNNLFLNLEDEKMKVFNAGTLLTVVIFAGCSLVLDRAFLVI